VRPTVLATLVACGFGLYGGAFFLLQPRAPAPAVIEAAARRILEQAQPTDLVLMLPSYAQAPRRWLGHLSPVAPERPELEDLEAAKRVWVFGQFGAGAAFAQALAKRGWPSETVWDEGGVQVFQLRNPAPWERVWALSEVLDRARLEHLFRGEREPCERRSAGPEIGCTRESDWLYVAPEWHRMGDHLRRCLWAHPPGEGALRLSVGGVPGGGVLRVQGGHTLQSQTRARAPVMMNVQFEGGGGGRLEFALEDTWRPYRIPVPATATGTVSFTVWSPDPGANHFCFVADVRRPGARS
jgi:hypothetical protein